MSSEAMKWARIQNVGNSTLKSVVNAIAARADKHGATWASQTALSRDLSISERSLRTHLKTLETLGVIIRTPRSKGRHGRTSDLTTLAMHRVFNVSAKDLKTPREKTSEKSSNRKITVVPTGKRFPGNSKRTTYEIIHGGKVSGLGTVGTSLNRPALAVVNGSFVSHGGGDEL